MNMLFRLIKYLKSMKSENLIERKTKLKFKKENENILTIY
jgi:hypothetical protein